MASSVIHMVVANEINKFLKKDNDLILIGSIAPDISKLIGKTKQESHFLNNNITDIPNIDKFITKYHNKLNNDFTLGYFIHLYTDYLWFKYFITEIYYNDTLFKIDGTFIKCNGQDLDKYIYNDYTNLDNILIKEYNLNLSLFYKETPTIKNTIAEIPIENINIIINKVINTINNSKISQELVFNIDNIKTFINTSTKLTLAKIKELNII